MELKIFEEITMDFLLVGKYFLTEFYSKLKLVVAGHTGNAVDQLFSILVQEFKQVEIRSVDDLFKIMSNSPITPKPVCEHLFYTFDWKGFIEKKLSKVELKYHSLYHSFQVLREKTGEVSFVSFRGKLYPQDNKYVPEEGIKLLQDDIQFDDIGPAEFRVDKLNLAKVFSNLYKYFPGLPLEVRIPVQSSWDALKETLEALPSRKDSLVKMKLSCFPKQSSSAVEPPPQFQFVEDDIPELQGELFPESLEEGNFSQEVVVGMDVCVYSHTKAQRPWLGRVQKVLPEDKFVIHWYTRRGRSNKFHAMTQPDGAPALVEQLNAVVMFWEFSEV